MADAKTWIDVADTAVKVGLGAMIGGGFTFAMTRLDHDRAALAEYARRRLDKIEAAVEALTSFNDGVATYWANLANALHKRETSGALPNADLLELKELESHLFESFSILNSVSTQFTLLSDPAAVLSVEDYKSACQEFFKIANIENDNCDLETLTLHREEMVVARSHLFTAIAGAYRGRVK